MSEVNTNKSKPKSKSRRKFLVRGGLGTVGVLALGTYVLRNPIRRSILEMAETLVPPYQGTGTEANLWFELLEDNSLVLHSPKVEMGQGTFTGLAQIVADELDIDIEKIKVVAAQTATGIVDGMSTGGSLSIAQLWKPLREMSATMRELIKQEAAKKLGVDIADISTASGILSVDKITMTYVKAMEGVTEINLPKTPELRSVKSYKHVGKPVSRVDLKAKVLGDPIFGIDAQMENMVHTTVIRPEHIGASIESVNLNDAGSMPGVQKIIEKPEWVAVVASSFAEALAARQKITVEWDIPKVWTEDSLRKYLQVGEGKKMMTQKVGSELGDNDESMETLEFTSPIGAHAQIEPNGAVAEVKNGKATIILSTQVIGITQKQVAEALGMKTEDVNIIGTYLGGGFGRRLNTNHAVIAALISKEMGQPVKYVFTRKEEFQNDFFRPPTQHIMKGKLEGKKLSNLEHHYASGDVAINSVLLPSAVHTVLGSDLGAMRGGNIMYDAVTNHRAVQWHKTLPFATSWWRSLGLLANTFAIESFVDEMAIKAGVDAVEMRLNMLSDEPHSKRIKAVIKKAADLGGFTDKVEGNTAMGFAASTDAGSPCAHVVEVTVSDDKSIKVTKVTCVLDCGLAVNPDQVRAQCEGSIIMGISASLYEKMTIQDGRLYPINYGTYEMALMKDSPREINIHLIQGVEDPLPVGEPPLGPIGAAIGNAVRRITGQRLRDLPMKLS